MMHIWGVLGDPKNASKIPPCRGDSLLERVRVLERSRDGVREGPGEKRRSDDARAPGVGAGGATRRRAKALERTGSALDHGGVAGFKGCRRCRRPRKGAAAAQAQIQVSSREYCNTLDCCQVGSKARGSSPFSFGPSTTHGSIRCSQTVN